jgi:hypothetical protein
LKGLIPSAMGIDTLTEGVGALAEGILRRPVAEVMALF